MKLGLLNEESPDGIALKNALQLKSRLSKAFKKLGRKIIKKSIIQQANCGIFTTAGRPKNPRHRKFFGLSQYPS